MDRKMAVKQGVDLNIGLLEEQRRGVCQLLNELLADEFVLYTKTRNYHWNVRGPRFHDLHKFFESQYNELNDIVDEVAERIRQLGDMPWATLAEFTQHGRLKEQPGDYPEAEEMIGNLLADHEAVIQQLRNDADTIAEKHRDMGTNDFALDLLKQHEKMAWMLRACLEPGR
ncbi:MAG: DNA starvation/stationary phase protection protein [Nitrospirota bacterium]